MEKMHAADVKTVKEFEEFQYTRIENCRFKNEDFDVSIKVLTGGNVPLDSEITLDAVSDSTPLVFTGNVYDEWLEEYPFRGKEPERTVIKENVSLQDVKNYIGEWTNTCENFLPIGEGFVLTETLQLGESESAPTINALLEMKKIDDINEILDKPVVFSAGNYEINLYPGYIMSVCTTTEHLTNDGGYQTDVSLDYAEFKITCNSKNDILLIGEFEEDHTDGRIIRTVVEAQERFAQLCEKGNHSLSITIENAVTGKELTMNEYLNETNQYLKQLETGFAVQMLARDEPTKAIIESLMDNPLILKTDSFEINLLPGYSLDVDATRIIPAFDENGPMAETVTEHFELAVRSCNGKKEVYVAGGWDNGTYESANKRFEIYTSADNPYEGWTPEKLYITNELTGEILGLQEYQQLVTKETKKKTDIVLEDR